MDHPHRVALLLNPPMTPSQVLAEIDRRYSKQMRVTTRKMLHDIPREGTLMTRAALRSMILCAFRAGAVCEITNKTASVAPGKN